MTSKNYFHRINFRQHSQVHSDREIVLPAKPFEVLSACRRNRLWKQLSLLVIGGLVVHQLYDWTGILESLEVEEYVTNAALMKAQRSAKDAKARGETPVSRFDEYMMNAPDLTPDVGYRIKTPGGQYAYYFEDEHGEPLLLDNSYNVWIWAGADVNNPVDDWLVRTPQGDVFNYYVDQGGQVQQKLLGNEKDLSVVQNTNLGTIVGFTNRKINDVHYRELPLHSLETYRDPQTGVEFSLPPPVLEEGFMNLQKKKNPVTKILSAFKNDTPLDYNEILDAILNKTDKLHLSTDPFINVIDAGEIDLINAMEKEGSISSDEAMQMKDQMSKEIRAEAESTLKGMNVLHLPSALGYVDGVDESSRCRREGTMAANN